MIVLCVSSCGWRLLLVLWCPRALGTKTLMLGLFSLHYHPPGFTVEHIAIKSPEEALSVSNAGVKAFKTPSST